MDNPTTTTRRDPSTDSPVYWFVILDRAVEQGDFETAARAKGELERLGVKVAYRRPRPPRREAACA